MSENNRVADVLGISASVGCILLSLAIITCFLNTIAGEPAETSHVANMALLRAVSRKAAEIPEIDVTPAFEIKANYEKALETMNKALEIKTAIDSVEFPKTEMVLTSLGKYYITGYTSLECGGSTMTASGAQVYYAPDSEKLTTPTTCAIDPVIHDFGDLFYIEEFDRVYIAKDTGSAVKKKHLDLYFPDEMYSYALSITGYYTVYSVEYVETTFKPSDYDIRDAVAVKVCGWKLTTD